MAHTHLKEEIKKLTLAKLPYPDLVKIRVRADGSCFFHAILRAFYRRYIEAESERERQQHMRECRDALADLLEEKNVKTGKTYYEMLSHGSMHEWAKVDSSYSLRKMRAHLQSTDSVNDAYHELISEAFGKDIYIVDLTKGDIYAQGMDSKLFHKGRNSIVLAYRPGHASGKKDAVGHFDLIGIRRKESPVIDALFKPDHDFIKMVRGRIQEQVKN